jgi:beta-glucosidase
MLTFPNNFLWGTATSSYQIEGASDIGGKGPSIWDAYCQIPGKIANGDTGKIACDHYHRMEEDVALMANMNVKAYRFSIAWARVLPDGTKSIINEEGIDFYNRLIDTLISHGIEPWITLYHWDLPLALNMTYDGWIDDKISDLFADYADICFERFGDRVKHWITINEAWVVAILGYGQGVFAPGRTSNTEPYIAGHNLLLAHAKAVDIYRSKYQSAQQGQIGITNNCDWREPATDSPQDQEAATRALEFFLGWFADPIYLGDYPQSMKDRLGDRLPTFTTDEITLVKGSSDFFGLNHYTTMYAAESNPDDGKGDIYGNGGLSEDQDVTLSVDPEWELTSMNWAVVPWGCQKLLDWIAHRYYNPPIYITENGCSYEDKEVSSIIADQKRIKFFEGYLGACSQAIKSGVNLKGYFIWSLLDNFEWASGYTRRFGIHYVDFETQERIPKHSAKWYAELISKQT